MKIYNVNVYDINAYITNNRNLITVIKKLDKIMVYKSLFHVRELVTNQPINVYDKNYDVKQKHFNYFYKYNCILGINKDSLIDENLATVQELEKYKYKLTKIKYLRFQKDSNTQVEIDKKIEQAKRMVK